MKDQSSAREGVSSFAKSLFFGEIHEDLVFPYPLSDDAEQDKVRSLIASAREFAAESEKALRKHGTDIILRQFIQKRIADAVADIYAQVAVLSRVTSIFEDQGVEVSGQERYIAETFCTRAAGRVESNLRQVEDHDDDRMTAIAKLAYKRGNYGYALFED